MPSGVVEDFAVKQLVGEVAQTLPHRTGHPELFYFFAPWCGVCEVSAPNALTVGRWFPEIKVNFIGLDYEELSEVNQFVENNLSGHQDKVYVGDHVVRNKWAIQAYPSYALINSDGKISHVAVGYSPTLAMAFYVLLAKAGF